MFKFLDDVIDIKNQDGLILGVGYGQSFSFRGGAEDGPSAIIDCFDNNMEIFDRFTRNEPYNILNFGYYELKDINKLSPEKMVEELSSFYVSNKDKFILMLGGDHSVSIGPFDALSKVYDPKEVTILQIDAHPDLRDNPGDYKEKYSKFDHACTMRRACEMGFKTVQVGLRTISMYDYEYINENKLKVFEWGRGKVPSVKKIINSIKTDKVYLTFDIDGLDPKHAPATGTPIPGGLDWFYTLELIRELILRKKLVGADIVEVAPFDDDVLTQYSAAHLCYNIISYSLLKQKGELKFYK